MRQTLGLRESGEPGETFRDTQGKSVEMFRIQSMNHVRAPEIRLAESAVREKRLPLRRQSRVETNMSLTSQMSRKPRHRWM